MALGDDEDDDGSNVWTEHLTEELPALMERMMLAILAGCLNGFCRSCSEHQFCLIKFTESVVKCVSK